MTKLITDPYRIPEKVKTAADGILPEIIMSTILQAKASGVLGVWIEVVGEHLASFYHRDL